MPSDAAESEFQRQEYLALSEQKAADFRTITAAVPTLFTASGAIFVAGVTQEAAYAVSLAPIPMLLAVYQMAQNSRLQLTMSTFLAVSSPTQGFNFEEHASKVRKKVWEAKKWDRGFGVLKRPSAYIITPVNSRLDHPTRTTETSWIELSPTHRHNHCF
jgi:hypothetical protein